MRAVQLEDAGDRHVSALLAHGERTIARRSLTEWLLFALAIEKCIQHVFVTWAFATDQAALRERVAVPYEALMLIGGVAAACYAASAIGLRQRRTWSPALLIVLALIDIIGEFVAQGTGMIEITLSFVTAGAILLLALRQRTFQRRAKAPDSS
jgi:hypothetical protein